MGDERFDHPFEIAIDDGVKLMKGKPNAVVCHAILRKVIGSNLLATVSGAYLRFPILSDIFALFLQSHIVEPRAKDPKRFGSVLNLRLFVLARNHQSCGQMSDSDGGVSSVPRLPARARGAERVDSQIFFMNLHFDVICLGKDRHCYRRSMDSTAGFCCRNTLDSMNATFILELTI